MTAIVLAEKLVRRHEGRCLVVYDDATGKPLRQGDLIVGHPTIGTGRNLAGRGISEAEANTMLATDLVLAAGDAEAWLTLDVWTRLGPERQAALIDFSFQLGSPRLARFKAAQAALKAGDYAQARRQMLESLWARQVPGRAREIAGIVESGVIG